jgi:hypothetical protein
VLRIGVIESSIPQGPLFDVLLTSGYGTGFHPPRNQQQGAFGPFDDTLPLSVGS